MHPFALLLLGIMLSLAAVEAHHEPEEQVASLTEELEEKGPSVEPLLERARLWRVLRKVDLAIADLKQAVALDEESLPARMALIEAYYVDGQLKQTVSSIEDALPLAEKQSPERAALHMRRASVRMLWKSYEEAVLDCEAAFLAHPPHGRIEWYLRRAYAQRMAQRFIDCEAGLRAGYEATGSIVLYTQWVDALIDAKRYEAAQAEVDKQLPGLRHAAAWRIRQARLSAVEGDRELAEEELKEAIKELDARDRPDASHPDIILLVDRSLAHFLLGNREKAQADYKRAVEAGSMGWMHWRLARIFEK